VTAGRLALSLAGLPRVAVRLFALFNPVRIFSAAVEGFAIVVRHRRLAVAVARRELSSRYAGQLMGSFWIVGHPLLQMLIFVFLFSVVFFQRIGGDFDLPRDYTVYILSGLVPWLSVLPVLTGSCASILGNVALVKQFSFEIEVLPIKDVLMSMVFWFVGIAMVAIYTFWIYHALPWTYLLLPIVFAVLVITSIGSAWLLSAVSVFFRDLKDIMAVWANLGVFLLPVVYLPQWVPDLFRPLVYANPLSYLMWIYQDTLYFGRIEHPWSWVIASVFALLMFTTGHRVFQRLRPLFGSAL
jgi:lipopolysaccharide transport system permease protein